MIFKRDNIVDIKGTVYRVICCDEKTAVLAHYSQRGEEGITSYKNLKAVSNMDTLSDVLEPFKIIA